MLAAREFDAAFTDAGMVLLLELIDEFVGIGDVAGLFHFFKGGIGFAISEVGNDGIVKKIRLLHN